MELLLLHFGQVGPELGLLQTLLDGGVPLLLLVAIYFVGSMYRTEKAAKDAKVGDTTAYIAEMLRNPLDRVAILRIASTLIPKELKTDVTERVTIVMGPDNDCQDDGEETQA